MERARREAVAFALLVLAAAGFSARRLRLGGDIAHFLPADGDRLAVQVSRALAASELSRTLLLVVEGPDPPRVRQAARALADSLRARPEVAWVRSGIDASSQRAFAALYLPRRHALLHAGDEPSLHARLEDDALRAAARSLRRRLASPAGAALARTAGEDPLGGFVAIVARAQDGSGAALRSVDGVLVTEDGRRAAVILATRASAFDAASQRDLLAHIDRIAARHDGVRVLRAGAHPITVAAEAQTRRDAQRVSALGSAGIAALFLALHRSPRYLALASLPVAAGTALALAACLLLFGSVHGLTLAFGASLIGVTFDYPVYLINHHTLRPSPEGTASTLARVWPGLRLGALTTIGGLLGMGLTSFPGLRELAVFAAVGVMGALVSTRVLVTPLLPTRPRPVALQRRLAEGVAGFVDRASSSGVRYLPLAMVAALCVVGLPRLRWDDDARALTRVDPALSAEARAARQAVGAGDDAAVILAMGHSDEEALQRNEIVAQRVEVLRRSGVVGGARTAHGALWSRRTQARNEAALRRDPTLPRRLDEAFAAEGFRPGAFEGFARSLRAPPPPPLSFDELAASPLADLVRPHRIAVGAQTAYVTFLQGAVDLPRVRAALRDVDGAVLFDQRSFLRDAYARYRRRTLTVLGGGLVFVFALLWERYRRVSSALAAMAPAAMACAGTFGVLGVAGVTANLMHLVGAILVLSVGVDYGIFMAEIERHPEASRETVLSVAVAWCTAVLSFGLLALSSAVPLRAIGLSTGVGVTLSLLLSPLARPERVAR